MRSVALLLVLLGLSATPSWAALRNGLSSQGQKVKLASQASGRTVSPGVAGGLAPGLTHTANGLDSSGQQLAIPQAAAGRTVSTAPAAGSVDPQRIFGGF